MLDVEMRDRFEAALRSKALRQLADHLREAGRTQVAIYDLFESFLRVISEEGRQEDEDAIGDALDCIWGWCSREAMWFDRTLTDQDVKEYRQTKSNPDAHATHD